MAFPTLVTETNGSNANGGHTVTSHTINPPASLVEGHTLILFLGCREAPTWTPDTGWTSLGASSGSNTKLELFEYTVPASPPASWTFTSSSGTSSQYRIIQFSGDVTTDVASAFSDVDQTTPDPPNHTPAGGVDDYTWLAVMQNRDAATVTGFPTNYTNTGQNDIADALSLAWGDRDLNASSENPGTFTAGNADWSAMTAAVVITAGGGGGDGSVVVTKLSDIQ